MQGFKVVVAVLSESDRHKLYPILIPSDSCVDVLAQLSSTTLSVDQDSSYRQSCQQLLLGGFALCCNVQCLSTNQLLPLHIAGSCFPLVLADQAPETERQ